MAEFDFGPVLAAVALVAIILATLRGIKTFNNPVQPPRPDQHLPADEYALLGLDYRDKVGSYFTGRRERDRRLAAALDRTCYPKNQQGRAPSQAGPSTPHGGTHATHR